VTSLRLAIRVLFWKFGDKDVDRFPPLTDAACEIQLPLCDTTALELGRALLVEPDGPSGGIVAETLRWDPFFLLWCVCEAGKYFDRLPSPGEIALWFSARGHLHFRSAGEASSELDCEFDDLIETSVTTAVLASRSARGDSAHLLGLLTESIALLRSCVDGDQLDSKSIECSLPVWLTNLLNRVDADEERLGTRPEADVQQSRSIIRAGREKLEVEEHRLVSEACRRALERFHTEIPAARGILPVLSQQLSRLRELETEFDATLQKEKLASLKQLAYGASHEINNPLANISTRAQTLLRTEKDPERHRQLATINSQAFRAHEMISDMMLFAHPPQLSVEPTDVRNLLDRVIEESSIDAERQGTRLAVKTEGDLPSWNIDPVQMTVALRALVRNSIEALGSRGQVVASVRIDNGNGRTADPALEISVADDGPGISPAAARHLFDPFFSGREAGRGLGFGLSKCWRIVELHGGEILVDSRPGNGASFTIRLPVLNCE